MSGLASPEDFNPQHTTQTKFVKHSDWKPIRTSARSALRWVMSHNPFYVISAALVLYGIHRSFNGAPEIAESWTLMKLLAGYSLLLACSGALIVRWGQVWEDARTVLLLIVFIFVAMSCSYDEVCLKDPKLGARFLGAGWLFAIALTEIVLRILRIRLSIWYRVPFYIQLTLMFAYAPWLAKLLLSGHQTEMSWFVVGFPAIAAACCLTLWPAAWLATKTTRENGTPWSWPWFPWPLFVFVCLGFCIRAYSLTVCFELELGLETGFQTFFLIPLGFAVAILALEIGIQGKYRGLKELAVWVPLLFVFPAGSSAGSNEMQTWYVEQVTTYLGSPLFLTLVGLVFFYAYAWVRDVAETEAMFMVSLAALAFVRPGEIGWPTEVVPHWLPVYLVIVFLAARSLQSRSSWRMALAMLLVLGFESYRGIETEFVAHYGYYPLHLAIVGLFVLPLLRLFSDGLVRFLRAVAPYALPGLAGVVAVAYRWVYSEVDIRFDAMFATSLLVLSFGYWDLAPRLRQAYMVVLVMSATSVVYIEALWQSFRSESHLEGEAWIAWGLVCLGMACAISLAKSGSGRGLIRGIAEWNAWAVRKRAAWLG